MRRRYSSAHTLEEIEARADLFWSHIDEGGPDDCWPFRGSGVRHRRFGWRRISEGKPDASIQAHRIAWELEHQRLVPDGLHVIHSCDNPPCCNPAHLRAATNLANIHDRLERGRYIGSQVYNARHTETEVREVLRLLGEGVRPCHVADLLGFSRQDVNSIRSGRSWRHITAGGVA